MLSTTEFEGDDTLSHPPIIAGHSAKVSQRVSFVFSLLSRPLYPNAMSRPF
jgi:hypothetical protein